MFSKVGDGVMGEICAKRENEKMCLAPSCALESKM